MSMYIRQSLLVVSITLVFDEILQDAFVLIVMLFKMLCINAQE